MNKVRMALEAVIGCDDERLHVLLSPAVEGMSGGPLLDSTPSIEINLVSLADDRTFEPALYHNPYFVLPAAGHYERYIQFLQALRHTDRFALACVGKNQHPTCLFYLHKDYLMLVMIRTEDELVEPPPADWTADAAALTAEDLSHLRMKLERLKQTGRARSAENGF